MRLWLDSTIATSMSAISPFFGVGFLLSEVPYVGGVAWGLKIYDVDPAATGLPRRSLGIW